jgi:hypothetical protein
MFAMLIMHNASQSLMAPSLNYSAVAGYLIVLGLGYTVVLHLTLVLLHIYLPHCIVTWQPASSPAAGDAQLVVSGGLDGVVAVWDIHAHQRVAHLDAAAPVHCVTVSPSLSLILAGR